MPGKHSDGYIEMLVSFATRRSTCRKWKEGECRECEASNLYVSSAPRPYMIWLGVLRTKACCDSISSPSSSFDLMCHTVSAASSDVPVL